MSLKQRLTPWMPPKLLSLGEAMVGKNSWLAIQGYLKGEQTPWSRGYIPYKKQFIAQALQNPELLDIFSQGKLLPQDYGYALDERCVEYPWLFTHLPKTAKVILDAGSTLNFDYLLAHSYLADRQLHIATLAPEEQCFWEKGISYIFADLRDLPLRSDYYDVVLCLSTLEHVGLDNRLFTRDNRYYESSAEDYKLAMQELSRVLKTGGSLFVSVPFGKYQNFGEFQQFDSALLAEAIQAFGPAQSVESTFFRYTHRGWQRTTEAECSDCEYMHWFLPTSEKPDAPDKAAAARAVACVHIRR
jgi:hypothetical protein